MRQATLLLLILLVANHVSAQDAPKRKSGLWEITRTTTYTQEKPKRIQVCVDEASDNALQQVAEGMRGETCTTNKLSQDGDKLVVDATCTLRATTAQTHAVINGKFDSAYTIESKSTYKPPLAGFTAGHAQLVARWTGPCAKGQHPGESILDTGVVSDSSGALEGPRPTVKNAKADTNAQTKSMQTGKTGHTGKPGATPVPNTKSVAPTAKASAPAAKSNGAVAAPAGTPPAPSPKSAAPAPTGTPPAPNPGTPDKNPAPSQ